MIELGINLVCVGGAEVPMKRIAVAFVLLLLPIQASASVITFEDLPSGTTLTAAGYAGLTWGTSLLGAAPGKTGEWAVDYEGVPPNGFSYSGKAYAYNMYGADQMWFDFGRPVVFDGAWFALNFIGDSEAWTATSVRFRDDLGHATDWFSLVGTANAPAYLTADFVGATRIWVDRQGAAGCVPTPGDNGRCARMGGSQWYAMDDVTYHEVPVPEPATLALVGLGTVGVWLRRRRGNA
jgi:hypothetical protein